MCELGAARHEEISLVGWRDGGEDKISSFRDGIREALLDGLRGKEHAARVMAEGVAGR